MKVIGKGEYADPICQYIQSSFPKIATISESSLLDILTKVIVGTKNVRYGPIPKPEGLVAIRNVIRESIENDSPITLLVPWGGRKMDKHLSLDVAEVSALKQLINLDTFVKRFFKPGIHAYVRIEDINAEWLYKETEGIEQYSQGMEDLIHILRGDALITPVRESAMMDRDDYVKVASRYSQLLFDVIIAQERMPSLELSDIPAYKELVENGWKGTIPKEQRAYYLDRYKRLYPNVDEEERTRMLAEYFGGSKARYDLNGRGIPQGKDGSFVQLNFAHPVPGAPASIFNNTVYYRTVPESAGRTHAAPWRAKGYLQIIDNEVVPKIAQKEGEVGGLETSFVEVLDGNKKVIVEADYAVYDSYAYAYPQLLM